jgi:TonB-dependent starch-binding outer membrane protein SusC
MTKFYKKAAKYLTVLLIFGAVPLFAQQSVSGKVTSSDDGSPIPGVNILEVGTTNGTVTDSDGGFTMQVGANATLSVSFIGYKTKLVPVGTQTNLAIVLDTDVTALQEVVVVGYGEVQKKDATGAVTAISNKDFNKGVITSPQDLLVGKLAGVSVVSSSGAPGSGSTIRIRGGASITASNDPLIIIDGFPVDNSSLSGSANPLASINPNDIETFTVLKDASATAIYGSRASNGVIIVTTKKGKSGKPQFSYNGTVSISSPIKYFDVLNATQYRTLVKDLASRNVSGLVAGDEAKLGSSNTDWQKEIFQDAISHDHNVSAAGSIKEIPYRISYGYTDQQGILKNTGIQRNSINLSVTPSLFDDHLKLTLNAKASFISNNFGEAGAVGSALSFDPTRPVKDNNTEYGGYFAWAGLAAPSGTANPVAQINQTDNKSTTDRIIANAQAEYKFPFFPDLKLNVNVGIDRSTSDGHNRVGLNAGFITATNNGVTLTQGRNNVYAARNQSELTDIYLNYSKQLGEHKIDLTAGYGWQHFYREGSSANSTYRTPTTVTGVPYKNENFLVSFFGRANYSFRNRYLLTGTLRNDGSSRFGPENRWGLFPAVAFAWKAKEEGFLAGVKVLSDLKFRVGYGITGQQDLNNDYYPYIPTITTSQTTAQYLFGTTYYPTLRPNAYNARIKWESTITYNVGVDFGLLDDKITGSIELYQRETTDALNRVPIPIGSNFSNFLTTNIGSIENRGIEITLKATPIQTNNFTWNVGFNFTRNINKITKLTLVDDPLYTGVETGGLGLSGGIQNLQIGFPSNSFFVFKQIYNANGLPAEGVYEDISGKGGSVSGSIYNKYRFQKPAADVLIGINSRATYKNFDFSFSGRISIGNYVYNNNISQRAYYNNTYQLKYFSNLPTAVNETKFNAPQIFSDYYVQNASFFKMDNLSLGYSFENILHQKLKARVSLTAQNAFIITEYKGLDPEVDGGIDNNIYPRPRVFLLGLNVTF